MAAWRMARAAPSDCWQTGNLQLPTAGDASSGSRQLIFGCATRFGPDIQAAFQSYVLLRHHELHQHTGLAGQSATLGVLLTPRTDGTRPWGTTLMHRRRERAHLRGGEAILGTLEPAACRRCRRVSLTVRYGGAAPSRRRTSHRRVIWRQCIRGRR